MVELRLLSLGGLLLQRRPFLLKFESFALGQSLRLALLFALGGDG